MVQTAVVAAAKQAVPQRTKQHIILCLYCMQQVVSNAVLQMKLWMQEPR